MISFLRQQIWDNLRNSTGLTIADEKWDNIRDPIWELFNQVDNKIKNRIFYPIWDQLWEDFGYPEKQNEQNKKGQ